MKEVEEPEPSGRRKRIGWGVWGVPCRIVEVALRFLVDRAMTNCESKSVVTGKVCVFL